jgi:hypothetical protein
MVGTSLLWDQILFQEVQEMMVSPRSRIRCAIYTRKSSEEGLEQSFNSLQAQREACEAYIASQRHEGWQVIKTHYDDGGFSGGTMKRPALERREKATCRCPIRLASKTSADVDRTLALYDARLPVRCLKSSIVGLTCNMQPRIVRRCRRNLVRMRRAHHARADRKVQSVGGMLIMRDKAEENDRFAFACST